MKSWTKVAVYGSLFMVCLFIFRLSSTNRVVFYPQPKYTEEISIPEPMIRKSVKREDLLLGLAEKAQPFKPLFFEKMVLKGIMKDNLDRWTAIFTDGELKKSSDLLKFAAGDTQNGITMINVNNSGCLVRYGNVERKFEIK